MNQIHERDKMDSQPNRGSCRATVHGQRMPTAKRKAAEAPAQSCASETKKQRKQRALPAMTIERDEHCGPVPDAAWQKDAESRKAKGRLEEAEGLKELLRFQQRREKGDKARYENEVAASIEASERLDAANESELVSLETSTEAVRLATYKAGREGRARRP